MGDMKGIMCENAKELAQRLHKDLDTKDRRYTLRPYNRFNVKKSMWWIVPSTVYPAYEFGKYLIDENKDGTFSVGVHIEKGLEKSLEYKRHLMMNETWVWHEFIESVKNGEIEKILLNIYEKMKDAVQIEIIVHIPKANEQLNYKLKVGQFINQDKNQAEDIKGIPDWINDFPQIEWFWVDFYIKFTFKKLNEPSKNEITEYEIVKYLLEPLEKWIK
ncbi:hypothetical protein [Fervidibacillus halotolerans]|uniref:Uncharacterized protein n=1 Tax=Fervidibacillus halotolerans TaxID=2980027 RepID=A0A9E8RZ92_9BACI|nr:hypothetical protein [Fervidibacillus halotolerans]WAA12944.1 hypothetical protein OE105_02110 [Fervidibacillus halotolerans]